MKKIFCIGHATYDITLPVKEYVKENTKVKIYTKVECSGGSSANSAILLSRWGMIAYFLGVVGKDIEGRKVFDTLLDNEVNLKYFKMVRDCNTSTSFILVSKNNGKRTITTYKDPNLVMNLKSVKVKPDVMLFDGEHLEASLKLIEENKSAIKIIDAGGMKKGTLKLCSYMDYVVCSKDFAEGVTKEEIDFSNMKSLEVIYDKLSKKYRGRVVITLEEHGAFAKDNNEYKLIPSIITKVIDSTGAGDIFHGAFTYFIANGVELTKAIRLSNIAGALSCKKMGSVYSIPPLNEVLKYDR